MNNKSEEIDDIFLTNINLYNDSNGFFYQGVIYDNDKKLKTKKIYTNSGNSIYNIKKEIELEIMKLGNENDNKYIDFDNENKDEINLKFIDFIIKSKIKPTTALILDSVKLRTTKFLRNSFPNLYIHIPELDPITIQYHNTINDKYIKSLNNYDYNTVLETESLCENNYNVFFADYTNTYTSNIDKFIHIFNNYCNKDEIILAFTFSSRGEYIIRNNENCKNNYETHLQCIISDLLSRIEKQNKWFVNDLLAYIYKREQKSSTMFFISLHLKNGVFEKSISNYKIINLNKGKSTNINVITKNTEEINLQEVSNKKQKLNLEKNFQNNVINKELPVKTYDWLNNSVYKERGRIPNNITRNSDNTFSIIGIDNKKFNSVSDAKEYWNNIKNEWDEEDKEIEVLKRKI